MDVAPTHVFLNDTPNHYLYPTYFILWIFEHSGHFV